jgi:type III polyketide synthase
LDRIQKLFAINRKTGISARPLITNYGNYGCDYTTPPSVSELSNIFRSTGVDLAVSACRKALLDARLSAADITHTVAVTCTDTSNPGYDILVNEILGINSNVDRILLHGVGCAGGLAALRTAANLATAAAMRKQVGRIMVISCELCSLYTMAELNWACEESNQVRVAPVLFSDAAAAVVVCNELGLKKSSTKFFELRDWRCKILEGTKDCMSMVVDPLGMLAPPSFGRHMLSAGANADQGYKTTISKDIPKHTVRAVLPMFDQMRSSFSRSSSTKSSSSLQPIDCDWAIHPGGAAILKGAKLAMSLSEDHMKASMDAYRNNGNSSSASVLIVLDNLRKIDSGRDKVVAAAFGPGLSIEMITMKRNIPGQGNSMTISSILRHRIVPSILWRLLRLQLSSMWLDVGKACHPTKPKPGIKVLVI